MSVFMLQYRGNTKTVKQYETSVLQVWIFFCNNLFEGLPKQWSYAPDDSDYMLHWVLYTISFRRWG